MERPPVRYARTPEGKIPYQVFGDGPIDIYFQPTGAWSLDVLWESAPIERFLTRLSSFSRVVIANLRGHAMADPIDFDKTGSAEDWVRDLTWILDDVGSEQAAYVAAADAAPFALLWAATYPERVSALVLVDGYACLRRRDDHPAGWPGDALDWLNQELSEMWGSGRILSLLAPELADDERAHEWYARMERGTMSPSTFAKIRRLMSDLDVRGILPNVHVPALVVEHTEDPYIQPGHGRDLADHLPNARLVTRPGHWGFPWLHDSDWLVEETQAFLTGSRGLPDPDDRVLATVLFTDIVDSTRRAATLGDARWSEVLAGHDAVVRRELERFRGTAVKSTGDGVLATFDGPARAIRCALAIGSALEPLDLSIRAGIHTGEIERRPDDIAGIAVHIGARVMAHAGPGEVLVSGAVPPLVAGSSIEFSDRGEHELRGVPGPWKLFAVRT